MRSEKKILNLLSLVLVMVILLGIVMFKYMADQQQESTLATVIYIILLIGSISTLALYYIYTKRDKSDYE